MPYRRVAELTPEELRLRRKVNNLRGRQRRDRKPKNMTRKQALQLGRDRFAFSARWQAASRAERLLAAGFDYGKDVDELYRRWQDWKTAERLLWLKGTT